MKALTKRFSGITLGVLFLGIAITGCNNQPTKDESANEAAADTLQKEITLSQGSQSLLYQFPTPFEVTNLLQSAKAGFIFDITNSPANVSKYGTQQAKALNLGVYSADLSYSATYNRGDETGQFLAATNKLADELGISGVYDNTLLEKIKKFGNQKDSLVAMISKVFGMTNEFLAANNRTQVAVMIAAGGFTEGLYLAASLNEVAKNNTKITAIIAAQKDNYTKLMTILGEYNADPAMKPILDEMTKLQPIWTSYGIESNKKLDPTKAAEIADLAESVRLTFVK